MRRDHLEWRHWKCNRSPRVERSSLWPQGLLEIPPPDPIPGTLDWDLWLGIADKRPFTANGKTEPDRYGGFFYQPFNWRGFYDFGCGALGDMACHILGAPNMALHLSKRKMIGVECVTKEGASPFMFPKASVIDSTSQLTVRCLRSRFSGTMASRRVQRLMACLKENGLAIRRRFSVRMQATVRVEREAAAPVVAATQVRQDSISTHRVASSTRHSLKRLRAPDGKFTWRVRMAVFSWR